MLQNTKGKKIHANIGNRRLTDRQVSRILKYLKGRVYSWCLKHPNDEFSVYLFFGHENSDWTGKPIQVLYENRCELKSSNPALAAGMDCGLLLRRMLQDDKRTYRQTSKTRPGRHYKLIPSKRRK